MARSTPNGSRVTLERFLVVAALVGPVLLSCSRPAQPAEADAKDVVATLYRDFAWEAVIDEPRMADQALIDQPRPVLSRYFDGNLVDLILRDRRCVAQSHDMCRLDYLPIWDGQEPRAYDMKILGNKDPSVVAVNFRYPGNGEAIELTYQMAKTNLGWRIHDIMSHRSRYSLLSVLSDTTK